MFKGNNKYTRKKLLRVERSYFRYSGVFIIINFEHFSDIYREAGLENRYSEGSVNLIH